MFNFIRLINLYPMFQSDTKHQVFVNFWTKNPLPIKYAFMELFFLTFFIAVTLLVDVVTIRKTGEFLCV